jgi:hypothetical protein
VPRICKDLFSLIHGSESKGEGGEGDAPDTEELKLYKVEVSYIEIYSAWRGLFRCRAVSYGAITFALCGEGHDLLPPLACAVCSGGGEGFAWTGKRRQPTGVLLSPPLMAVVAPSDDVPRPRTVSLLPGVLWPGTHSVSSSPARTRSPLPCPCSWWHARAGAGVLQVLQPVAL